MAIKKKKEDPITELLTAGLVLLTIFVFFITQSIGFTLAVGLIVFLAILLLQNNSRKKREQEIRNSGILEIDKMSGVQFEEYLRLFFLKAGYIVKTTPASGDFGADLLLEKESKRIVVQAKRYKSNVGIKAVQEVASAKNHYQATETWVITNSNYTKAAQELAASNGVKLIGREKLMQMILQLKNKETAKQTANSKAIRG